MADNASITILRNTKANIDAEPIKDGNILFTTDQANNAIYTDVGTRRIKIGGTVDIDTTLSTTSTEPVQNKVITNSINEVRGQIQNLQIGGRNLIKDSKDEISGNYPNNEDNINIFQISELPIPGYATQFVLSFEAKSTIAGDIIHSFFFNPPNITRAENSDGIVSNKRDGDITTTLTTDWKRYWVKWTAPIANSRNLIVARLNTGEGSGTVSVRNVKFETGTVPTDWTPAIDDDTDTPITNSEIDTILNS